jgi:hypothetical protein
VRSRVLFAVPFACALAYLGAHALAGGDPPTFHLATVLVFKVLALAGCIAAASRFDRGDRMRIIWLLFVVDFALLILKDVVASDVLALGPRLLGVGVAGKLRTLCLLGGNVAGTAAWIVLVRTFRIAGLTLAGSPARQRALLGVAIAAALALVGWGTLHDVRALADGRPDALLDIISDVADVIGFSLVAPVALTAYTLRGGSLSWPYLYLAACTVSWMVYDMTDAIGGALGADPVRLGVITQTSRALACGFHFAAGIAARWAVRGSATEPTRAMPPKSAVG